MKLKDATTVALFEELACRMDVRFLLLHEDSADISLVGRWEVGDQPWTTLEAMIKKFLNAQVLAMARASKSDK